MQILATPHGDISYRTWRNFEVTGDSSPATQSIRRILFFHGFPGSSLQIDMFVQLAAASGSKNSSGEKIEVIAFDRYGYNQTLFELQNPAHNALQNNLAIIDHLLNHFHWSQFEIVTVSGGTPLGLIYAMQNPQRIVKSTVICGLGALHQPQVRRHIRPIAYWGLKFIPDLPGDWVCKALLPPPGRSRSVFMEKLLPFSPKDLTALTTSATKKSMQLILQEALQQNAKGPQADARIFHSPWAKDLSLLTGPIHFWHGEKDQILAPQIALQMSALIPQAQCTIVPGEGHFSLPMQCLCKILCGGSTSI
ncbi:MAG: alpha/beta fold hydrolase [Pseudobdellovibrionaceae bacterium]